MAAQATKPKARKIGSRTARETPENDPMDVLDEAGGRPVDSPERRRLPILLRRAWYGLNQAFRRRIAHTGVTPDQFTVLRTLLEGPAEGINQSELTRLMASDPNTIAALVERMLGGGLIERREHERDRRAYRIRLTAAGKQNYRLLRKIAVDLQSSVLSRLPAERREQFLTELAAVSEACRDEADRVKPAAKPKTESPAKSRC